MEGVACCHSSRFLSCSERLNSHTGTEKRPRLHLEHLVCDNPRQLHVFPYLEKLGIQNFRRLVHSRRV
jgi:Uri superfamily endonuclease